MQGLRSEILHGVPDHVYRRVRELEDSFMVGTPELKKTTNHFIKGLEKGLTVEGGDMPMNVTWVMGYPTGEERGQYLTLDMGGTNLRVCDVVLCGREEEFQITQSKYKLPEKLRNCSADDLWDYTAECLRIFLRDHRLPPQPSERLALAFTFSYPVTQNSVKDGILQHWTKCFNVKGVEGHAVVPQLQAALERKEVPIDVVALCNDTTGTLISSAYRDPEIRIGSIISTGCNAAYMEECGAISKIKDCAYSSDSLVAINTECGAFDNQRRCLPRTTFDELLDKQSAHPGAQLYEKMVAGMYLGEIIRLVLIQLHNEKALFVGQDISLLQKPYIVDTPFLTTAEDDVSESLTAIRKLLTENLGVDPDPCELKVCRYLVELIGTRAARLYACSTAAICRKRNIERCHVGVDGAVFNCYYLFRSRASQALREILDWPYDASDLITFHEAEDGSGVGAAIIAALALDRDNSGKLKELPGANN